MNSAKRRFSMYLISIAIIFAVVFAVLSGGYLKTSVAFADPEAVADGGQAGETAESVAEPTANNKVIEITSEALQSDEGKDVKDIFNYSKAEGGSLTLVSDNVTITFDEEAVNKIAGQDVRLRVTVLTENLEVYNVKDARFAVDIALIGIGFEGGNIKVSVPVSNKVEDANTIKVYYVNGEEITDMNAKYEDSCATFETNHFSLFVIVYPEEVKAGFNGFTTEVMIAIGATAFLVVTIILIICIAHANKKKPATNNGPAVFMPIGVPVNNGVPINNASSQGAAPVAFAAQHEQEAVPLEDENCELLSDALVEAIREENAKVSATDDLYGKVMTHIKALEGVNIKETKKECEVSCKDTVLVRFVRKYGEAYALFNSGDNGFQFFAPGFKKALSVLKIKDVDSVNRIVATVDNKYYKSLSGQNGK